MIKLDDLICNECPAFPLREMYFKHFSCCEKIREQQIFSIDEIKLFLLGESIPADRFIYDLGSDYSRKGLRFHLKRELKIFDDQKVIEFLRSQGILICDCALCPLHKIGYSKKDLTNRNIAATICLENNTKNIFENNSSVPIITFFSKDRGFNESNFPEIKMNIIKRLPFNLTGLIKVLIELGIKIPNKV